ncbi:MAG: SPOR domain-containing protein [Tenacibaculum sp.]|nr:SPOR domain-containing protein [Tenacibaculum sp.]
MKINNLYLTLIITFFLGCLISNAQLNINKTENITSLIKKKREFNKRHGTGFRIQIYNGVESRARSLKIKFEKKFRGVYTKLNYIAPEWKVQVGNYLNRLDADRELNKIREEFPSAIIIPL